MVSWNVIRRHAEGGEAVGIKEKDGGRNAIKAMNGPSTGAAWHAMEPEAVGTAMGSGPQGLAGREAARRLEENGPNTLEETGRTPAWRMLLGQFVSPLIVVLLVCVVITLALREWVDAGAIALVLILNAAIGFTQERRAQGAADALKGMTAPEATVLRDGSPVTVDVATLVPGDLVLLESGDRVPADLRLLDTSRLMIDESMLTGESDAASKGTGPVDASSGIGDRTCMAFSGTMVASGRARGLVVATGSDTELGEIGDLAGGESDPTPLQVTVRQVEKWIGVAVVVVAVAVFIGGALIGGDVPTSFLSAVSLMVAAMPESLPVVLTIAMALGVSRLAGRHVLAKTLPAVETLGSVTVVGSDKTGTLTQNRMTVETLADGSGVITRMEDLDQGTVGGGLVRLLRAGAAANDATVTETDGMRSYTGDAVDAAMLGAADGLAGDVEELRAESRRVAETPYEPELLHSMAVIDADGSRLQTVKGAPDMVASLCSRAMDATGAETDFDHGRMAEAYGFMGSQGLRVIGVAARRLDAGSDGSGYLEGKGFTWLGMEGMMDPPRPGVREAIADCNRAGIRVIMITGDHPVTAAAIGRRLGLAGVDGHDDDGVLTGADMRGMGDRELDDRLRDVSVAARMSPQDKLRIVTRLRAMGERVAVTGDGVNDAPALKRADVGVAMGVTGTDVAREAGDLILTDDSFGGIVSGVRQGRATFKAIRSSAWFLLSTALAAMIAVGADMLSGGPAIFLPLQMLWINMVTNGVQDLALGTEDGDGTELDSPPTESCGLLGTGLWVRLGVAGLWMGVAVLTVFRMALASGVGVSMARTMALTVLVLFNFFVSWSARSETRPIIAMNPMGNPFLLVASFGALAIHAGAMYIAPVAGVLGMAPMGGAQWLACLGVAVTVLIVCEGGKLLRPLADRLRG